MLANVHVLTCCTRVQGDLNLNICEAHAFNTLDKFSLDVFVVNGWKGEVRTSGISPLPALTCVEFCNKCMSSLSISSQSAGADSSKHCQKVDVSRQHQQQRQQAFAARRHAGVVTKQAVA